MGSRPFDFIGSSLAQLQNILQAFQIFFFDGSRRRRNSKWPRKERKRNILAFSQKLSRKETEGLTIQVEALNRHLVQSDAKE